MTPPQPNVNSYTKRNQIFVLLCQLPFALTFELGLLLPLSPIIDLDFGPTDD
jgi:hypothetical protein